MLEWAMSHPSFKTQLFRFVDVFPATTGDADAARVDELLRALIEATSIWPPDDRLERDDIGPLPRVNVSIKPTALTSFHDPLSRGDALTQAKARLRPILRGARDGGAHVH